MPLFDYRGENHDWDMTLSAAGTLLALGRAASEDRKIEFSTLTASMLLSLTAVESFTNSVAFLLPQRRPDLHFKYKHYENARGFWPKINQVCKAASVNSSDTESPFDVLEEGCRWRNMLVHAEPYSITAIAVENTTAAIHSLHEPYHVQEYARSVTIENAVRYFEAARAFVRLLTQATNIEPRSSASYTPSGEPVRTQRNAPHSS